MIESKRSGCVVRNDGSSGEGGGQILPPSLSLSLATGNAFRIENIRVKRERPGLLRQHLTTVLVASEIGGAARKSQRFPSQRMRRRQGESSKIAAPRCRPHAFSNDPNPEIESILKSRRASWKWFSGQRRRIRLPSCRTYWIAPLK